MTEPYEKSYELPMGESISKEEAQAEYEQGLKFLSELTEAYAKTKTNENQGMALKKD